MLKEYNRYNYDPYYFKDHRRFLIDGISYGYMMFHSWVEKRNPDMVTRKVLYSLMIKYEDGNKEPLFKKMQQLIRGEHYELCVLFHDMFIYTSIYDEYKNWEQTQI
jgi:hypothetical protein